MQFFKSLQSDKRTFFMPDAPRGGGDGWGGSDPHDHDDHLARSFKAALGQAKKSSTPGTPALHESIEGILERVDAVGRLLMLLSRDLQPIARRLNDIPGYSDKRNPVILTHKFADFDLGTGP